LAYDIRQDADYTRRRLAEHSYQDSPALPAILGAAHRYAMWCDAASEELLTNLQVDTDELREMWRREAVLSDIRFVPYGDLATFLFLGCGTLAGMGALFASDSITIWIKVAVLGAVALAALGYRQLTSPRLAVGPDAHYSTLAKASARELFNSAGRPPRPRHQPRPLPPRRIQ
jgi:hypothetical protein